VTWQYLTLKPTRDISLHLHSSFFPFVLGPALQEVPLRSTSRASLTHLSEKGADKSRTVVALQLAHLVACQPGYENGEESIPTSRFLSEWRGAPISQHTSCTSADVRHSENLKQVQPGLTDAGSVTLVGDEPVFCQL
jgi:hypothetical protein